MYSKSQNTSEELHKLYWPLPVCRWKAEPRAPSTSPESPGQPVRTASSCSPAESAWWMWAVSQTQPEPGATGAAAVRGLKGLLTGEAEQASADGSDGHWTAAEVISPEIMPSGGGGGGGKWGQQTVCVSSRGETSHRTWREDLQLLGSDQHICL